MTNSDKEYSEIFHQEWNKGINNGLYNHNSTNMIYTHYINIPSFEIYRKSIGAKSFTDLSIKPGLR